MIILKCPTCGAKIQLEEERLKSNWDEYHACPNCLCEISPKALRESARVCQDIEGWKIYRTDSDLLQSNFCGSQIESFGGKA